MFTNVVECKDFIQDQFGRSFVRQLPDSTTPITLDAYCSRVAEQVQRHGLSLQLLDTLQVQFPRCHIEIEHVRATLKLSPRRIAIESEIFLADRADRVIQCLKRHGMKRPQEVKRIGKRTMLYRWAEWPPRPWADPDGYYEVEIVAISVDMPQMVNRARAMFEKNGWDYTFLHDSNQELMEKLGIQNIPYSILIDGNGKIQSVQMGYYPDYEKHLEKKIKQL